MSDYVLIISIISVLGQGGLSEAHPFSDLETCLASARVIEAKLKGRVTAVDAVCTRAVPRPAVKPTRRLVPPPKPKAAAGEPPRPVGKPIHKAALKTVSMPVLRVCAHKRYRIVRHQRVWHCRK